VANDLAFFKTEGQPIFQRYLDACHVKLHADVERYPAQRRVDSGFVPIKMKHK
jgi:hypothetical protein